MCPFDCPRDESGWIDEDGRKFACPEKVRRIAAKICDRDRALLARLARR